ncbi:MAG TPA: hypothetical protein VGF97_00005 [Rhizomicrobium sp.]
MWRVFKFVLFALGAIVPLGGGVLTAMVLQFNHSPSAFHYGKPKSALEAQRQDIDYFMKLLSMDRSFSALQRAHANSRLKEMADAKVALSPPAFRVALMEIAALSDNGHTSVTSGGGAMPMQLPVRVAGFSDGIYVMQATKPYADLLGGKVTAIDGHPIAEVMRRLEQLRGGVPGWRKAYAETYISQLDVLVGTGISPDLRQSVWTVVSPSRVSVTHTLIPYRQPDREPTLFVKVNYSNHPPAELGPNWVSFQPDTAPSATFANFEEPFRHFRVPHSCAMFVQLKSSEDEGQAHISDFLAGTRADMEANKPCALILDNRFNDGGDYINLARWASALPRLVSGKIIVLISPMTFSAGITTVGFVKQAGDGRVMLIGEPVGDRLAFYSEGNRGCLPHFHLCLNYRTGKHDYAHPCTDWRVCFWPNWLFPVRVSSLAPDRTLAMSFEDWRMGRDPAYDEALKLVGSK